MRVKSELYKDEQNRTIDKIIHILGITETKNTITLYEIDNNETMKQQFMDLIPEIRKWFSFSHITPISNPYIPLKRVGKKQNIHGYEKTQP